MRALLPRVVVLGLALLTALLQAAESEPRPLLAPIFGDHMVLQRDKPNTFWGWARAGEAVRVRIGEQSAQTIVAADGRWHLAIDVPPAGGPYEVTVEARERVTLRDVLVGDVWLCSGQSNMEFPLQRADDGAGEAQRANLPQVRLYKITRRVAYAPAESVDFKWKVCTPEAAATFSAVACYFGRKLHTDVGVPIGLIQSALGGSPVESWMSAAALTRLGEFAPQLEEIARLRARGGAQHGSFLMHWLDEHDVGGRNEAWSKPDFDDRAWKTVTVPGGFRELGVPTDPAIAWFRREVTLPEPLPAGAARLLLGVVERMDTAYINGRWIGASSWVENPRAYIIPDGVLRPGKNAIAVRVFKTKPEGGFMSAAETLRLQLGDGRAVPLAGEWRAKVSFDARPPAKLPLDFENYPTMPTVLYNGMIAPVAPLAIAGAIWYQGEANTTRAEQYRKLLPAMIADWRGAFGQGEFPFYIVSLPAFMTRRTEPGTDGWAELRDAQAFTARTVRNTGLAITIDTGEADNIHPTHKRPVGERLALCALAGHYRRDVIASGPTLRLVERRPGELRLHFDHAHGGLRVQGDTLAEFSVSDAGGKWHWADARIEGTDVVIVSSRDVPVPVHVRYAWQGNPRATLFNGAGLPAGPFRTDE